MIEKTGSLRRRFLPDTIFSIRRLCHLANGGVFLTPADLNPMSSDLLQLELTDRQRELLLRGLRFVRSSRMMEIRESSDITDDQRKTELGEIRELAELLGKDAGK